MVKDSPPLIRCENVSISYNGKNVLHDVSLDIESGSFLPFVGANGAGKTTLLRAILGFIKPCRGRIITPFADRPVGYVPQQKAINPLFPVSVRGLIKMGLYPRLGFWKRPDRELEEKINAVQESFQLTGHQHQTFDRLSGGMRQKALLARAVITEADVFIMDEATSELDEQSELEIMELLHSLSRDQGKTILLAYHGLARLSAFTESICLLEQGRAEIIPLADQL